jgi:VWA domain-containing protein
MTPLLVAALLAQGAPSPAAGEPRTIILSVVDDKGQPIRTLEANEVSIQENGVARELTKLELDRRPLVLAVVVDNSEPMASTFRLHVADAVTQFLLRLPEGTKYSVWTTGDRPLKVYDFGDNRTAANKALRRAQPHGGNRVLDAIVEASKELKEREDARSALVVVTGSGPGFSDYDRRQVVDIVEDLPIEVLSVVIGDGTLGALHSDDDVVGGVDYDYALASLAKSSGGLRETVLSPMAVEHALRKLAAHLSGQYRATFLGAGGRKSDLDVAVALPGVKVSVRERVR